MISCTQTSGATTPAPSNSSFTPGPWQVEDPFDFELSIVANGQAGPGDWTFVAGCKWPGEDNHDITSHEVTANAYLITAAPDYATACGVNLHPGEAASCGPLSWLRSAIDTLAEDAVREAAQGDDPDAYFEMMLECRSLLAGLETATLKARGAS
jgi:hypothetical protein